MFSEHFNQFANTPERVSVHVSEKERKKNRKGYVMQDPLSWRINWWRADGGAAAGCDGPYCKWACPSETLTPSGWPYNPPLIRISGT